VRLLRSSQPDDWLGQDYKPALRHAGRQRARGDRGMVPTPQPMLLELVTSGRSGGT